MAICESHQDFTVIKYEIQLYKIQQYTFDDLSNFIVYKIIKIDMVFYGLLMNITENNKITYLKF